MLKFFTGNTQRLDMLTSGLSQYIALNTQTGQMYWNHLNQRYYMNYVADWDISDSSLPSFIKHKPHILTIADLINVLDVSELADQYDLVATYREPIVNVVDGGGGKYYFTPAKNKRRPVDLITSNGAMYSVQTDSLTISNDNVYTIQLSRYMAYQNITEVPTGWSLIYA